MTLLHFLYDFAIFQIDGISDDEIVNENLSALSQVRLLLLLLTPYFVWLGELVATVSIIRSVRRNLNSERNFTSEVN